MVFSLVQFSIWLRVSCLTSCYTPHYSLLPTPDILHYSQEPPVGCVRQSRNAPLSWDSVGYAAANPPYKLLIEDGARSELKRVERLMK